MLSALFKTPLWVRLRFVSNSAAAKATILVPVIGYLIIFNEKVVDFLNLARSVEAHSGAEVSYRLILIYLGLCAISVGVVVYGWFCPNEVKHYGSASAYVRGDGPSLRGFVINDIGKLLETSAQRDRLEVSSNELHEKSRRDVEITDEDFDRYRIEVLHLHFEYLNSSHGAARAICFWSYVVGFGLLAIPSLIVFKRVIGILIGMMF
jgi:predicted membrane channel-forming protein YqfA (hemolysin III family)